MGGPRLFDSAGTTNNRFALCYHCDRVNDVDKLVVRHDTSATFLKPCSLRHMNRLIPILTAAMTLSHAVLGCCAHAAQGSGSCNNVPGAYFDHHQYESALVDDSHEPLDQRAPGRGHECCRVKCQWLAPITFGDLAHELLWYSTIFDEDQITSSRSSYSLLSVASSADSLFALPVRSHLALSVLLI